MRDKIKDEYYFNTFIEEDLNRISKFLSKLNQNKVVEENKILVKTKIQDLKFGILIARYSRGDVIDDLVPEYIDILKEVPNYWRKDFYSRNLELISLGILLNQQDMVKEVFGQLLKKDNIHDWLYDFMIYTKVDESELLFPEIYKDIKQLILSNEESKKIEVLKRYINNWYNLHKDCGWHDSHKSKFNTYNGYWSFEAGAIAKILGIDDKELKNVKYYPYDMVHFKDESKIK